MIVVTGSCRTGTSLMMQTVKFLGVPVVGMDFHKDFSNKKLNPKGYWDMPIEHTINGIQDANYKDSAIKLFGAQLYRTPAMFVSKLIVCIRNKTDAIKSTAKLIDSESKILNKYSVEITDDLGEKIYRFNYEHIHKFIIENVFENVLYVSFENMLRFKEKEINRIAHFLNKKPTVQAYNNIGV